MLIAQLFMTAPKEPGCPSEGDWLNKRMHAQHGILLGIRKEGPWVQSLDDRGKPTPESSYCIIPLLLNY